MPKYALAAAAALLCAAAAWFWISLPAATPLRQANPGVTALMKARGLKRPPARWVPLKAISPWLRDAVVNSEDARFYEHAGIDPKEIEAAVAQGARRGASTI